MNGLPGVYPARQPKHPAMKTLILAIVLTGVCACGRSQEVPSAGAAWSERIARSFLVRHAGAVTYDSGSPAQKWNYEQGLILVSLVKMWQHTGDRSYFNFVRENLDRYIGETGDIKTYPLGDFNLDNIAPGRAVLALYNETHEKKFRSAADTLRRQLREQPRTKEGGFWHKNVYPNQMWLDGLFMAEPFYARYASQFDEPTALDDVAFQFIVLAHHAADPKTGLFYHAWDESKSEQWADRATGCSPTLWGRAMGWYLMGLVDVLDDLPNAHPRRAELVSIFRNLSGALLRHRDDRSHLWYQVVNEGKKPGNYLESSASAMFIYAFAKGVRMNYLEKKFLAAARESFDGIIREKVAVDGHGFVDLHGTCGATGLGGRPYRDGSFRYYTEVPQRTNDLRGVGAFLLAAIELENAAAINITEEQK